VKMLFCNTCKKTTRLRTGGGGVGGGRMTTMMMKYLDIKLLSSSMSVSVFTGFRLTKIFLLICHSTTALVYLSPISHSLSVHNFIFCPAKGHII
jgi:hypothetical protein